MTSIPLSSMFPSTNSGFAPASAKGSSGDCLSMISKVAPALLMLETKLSSRGMTRTIANAPFTIVVVVVTTAATVAESFLRNLALQYQPKAYAKQGMALDHPIAKAT